MSPRRLPPGSMSPASRLPEPEATGVTPLGVDHHSTHLHPRQNKERLLPTHLSLRFGQRTGLWLRFGQRTQVHSTLSSIACHL